MAIVAELAAVRKRYNESGESYLARQVEIMELEADCPGKRKAGQERRCHRYAQEGGDAGGIALATVRAA